MLGASKMYMVPENTLRDRVLGKIDPDNVVMGKLPLFTQYEEAKIVEHIKTMASFGYGYTVQECVDLASDFATQLGKRSKDKPLSTKWMKGLRGRWPEIKKFTPRALEHVRAKMSKESVVAEYFENLQACIEKYDLTDKPHLIFNVDEKGISINHKPPNVIASVDICPQSVTSGKGKTVTILGCGSASGVAIPPFFVFPGKRMNSDLLHGSTPGAAATLSETGWSNSEVFRTYLETHFLKFIPGRSGEKVLLILDGHRSHVSVGLVDWAKTHDIILFILPAHTSHILQPLDVACYGPFQRMYDFQCHRLIRQTSAAITRYNVSEIASKVYSRALSAENLQAGFKKTGIYPLNMSAIPSEYMVPSEVFITHSDVNAVESDSDATVEGGVLIADDEYVSDVDMFEVREQNLRKIKSEVVSKPRKCVSAIVSGKEITNDLVYNQLSQHEKQQKPKAKGKAKQLSKSQKSKKSQSAKISKPQKGKKSQSVKIQAPQPGPSHINLLQISEDFSDDDVNEDDKCCVCGLWTPVELSRSVSVTFAKWAKCDGMVDGFPCKHWTHLIYCCDTRVIRKDDKFLCPHCDKIEE